MTVPDPDPTDLSAKLIQNLQQPTLFSHPVLTFGVLETHISWVLLTGPYAYKIKKPVNLGFVDFSTLERRRFFCEEELRLNRRLAPDLYQRVVCISGSVEHPEIDGTNPPIEYAVQMKQFPQENLLPRVLIQGLLHNAHIDGLAKDLAVFHSGIQVAAPDTPFGLPHILVKPVLANFEYLLSEDFPLLGKHRLAALRDWTDREHEAHLEIFVQRKENGCVRACHGDLHLGNMALIDDRVVIFDGIEFSNTLRWIDVMSELAFIVMDLIDRGRPKFAYRLLNHYLEYSGDYHGLTVFRYYLTYRAMVRAKVAGIRLKQEEKRGKGNDVAEKDLEGYLDLAERLMQPMPPSLIIMHGLSGSGKSTISQHLLELLGAIRLRSDIERKRLFGLVPDARSQEDQVSSLYGKSATERTYFTLRELTESLLDAGHPVIVDATFLRKADRQPFQSLATRKHVPFLIIDVAASTELMKDRVRKRERNNVDASEATVSVLESQMQHQEAIAVNEEPFVVRFQNDEPFDSRILSEELAKKGFKIPA